MISLNGCRDFRTSKNMEKNERTHTITVFLIRSLHTNLMNDASFDK